MSRAVPIYVANGGIRVEYTGNTPAEWLPVLGRTVDDRGRLVAHQPPAEALRAAGHVLSICQSASEQGGRLIVTSGIGFVATWRRGQGVYQMAAQPGTPEHPHSIVASRQPLIEVEMPGSKNRFYRDPGTPAERLTHTQDAVHQLAQFIEEKEAEVAALAESVLPTWQEPAHEQSQLASTPGIAGRVSAVLQGVRARFGAFR